MSIAPAAGIDASTVKTAKAINLAVIMLHLCHSPAATHVVTRRKDPQAQFAVITAASCGAVNAMYDSFGGMIPLINIQLGEIIGGGGGMLLFVIISIFCWCSKLVRYSPTNVLTETGIGYRLRPSD